MPRPPDSTISASVSSGSPVETSSRRSTNLICAAAVAAVGRSTVAVAPPLGRPPPGGRRGPPPGRGAGDPPALARAARDARALADALGHHLLRRSPPVVFDDAPERVRHRPVP